MSNAPSFLRLHNIPLRVHTTFWLTIQALTDTWVPSTFWPLQIVICGCEHGYATMCSALCFQFFGVYTKVRLLDKTTIPHLIFWGTAIRFSGDYSLSMPSSKAQGFPFLHIPANTCYFQFFGNHWPNGCEVVFHCGFDLHFPNDKVMLSIFSCTYKQ